MARTELSSIVDRPVELRKVDTETALGLGFHRGYAILGVYWGKQLIATVHVEELFDGEGNKFVLDI
jgi:hypothetical protein